MTKPVVWPLGDKYVPRLCLVCKREINVSGKIKKARNRSPHKFRMKYARGYIHPWCWDSTMEEVLKR